MNSLSTIILAAGQGTRMKSPLPKILHSVAGQTMIESVIEKAQTLRSQKTVLVVPKENQKIRESLKQYKNVNYAVQNPPKGTAHAVMQALPELSKQEGDVIILYGDMPLVTLETLKELLAEHRDQNVNFTFVTSHLEHPFGYGRVIRDADGQPISVVEEKDATDEQKNINEVNVGIYVANLKFLREALKNIKSQNAQNEFYLTDLIFIAAGQGSIYAYDLEDPTEGLGVNTQKELTFANAHLHWQKIEELMAQGVRVLLPDQVIVDKKVKVGAGSVLMGPCYLLGNTRVGENSIIQPNVWIKDSTIGSHVEIKASCYIEESIIGNDAHIGPMAHLRPSTKLADKVKVGNFVEIKKSNVGEASKVNHLSYIGDAKIGKKVNIGAGTITCNYDGKNKFQTVIDDGAFIGSDSQLVAPVRVGKNAYIGSGSTITKNVLPDSLALTRTQQVQIKGWAKKKR